LLNKFFGWQPFLNNGVAFGLPVPMVIITVMSVLIIILFIYLLVRDNNGRASMDGARHDFVKSKKSPRCNIKGVESEVV